MNKLHKYEINLHLRNNVQRNIPNDQLFIHQMIRKMNVPIYNSTYTSDFIDGLFNNIRSSGVDARKKPRASSGVRLCVASSFYTKQNKKSKTRTK